MKATDDGYLFESTNREILTHWADGFSITESGSVRVGYEW